MIEIEGTTETEKDIEIETEKDIEIEKEIETEIGIGIEIEIGIDIETERGIGTDLDQEIEGISLQTTKDQEEEAQESLRLRENQGHQLQRDTEAGARVGAGVAVQVEVRADQNQNQDRNQNLNQKAEDEVIFPDPEASKLKLMGLLLLFFCFSSCFAFPFVADPPVPHYGTSPSCITSLFSRNFTTYNSYPFNFTVPSESCFENAKIILRLSLACSAGRQFDRSIYFEIGGAYVFIGTTSEPDSTQGPRWIVNVDITEFSSLLKRSTTGSAQLGTNVSPVYNGVPFMAAQVLFYREEERGVCYPEQVIPLGASTTNTLSASLSNIPAQLSNAYVLFNAQGQADEEFWWSCAPSNVSKALETCGGGSFRALEVRINDTPVALSNVVPYIFTGGIDPFLWQPIPAVQTLHLLKQRIDIHPGFFGSAQTVNLTLSVLPKPNNYWMLTATLFVDTDEQVSGRDVLLNTLPDILSKTSPSVQEHLNFNSSSGVIGTLDTSFKVKYSVSAFLKMKNGTKIQTNSALSYAFLQSQNISQSSSLTIQSGIMNETRQVLYDGKVESFLITSRRYPLRVLQHTVDTGKANVTNITTSVWQSYESADTRMNGYSFSIKNDVFSNDTLTVNTTKGFSILSHCCSESRQSYSFKDSLSNCYSKSIKSSTNVLNSTNVGCNSLQSWCDPYYGTNCESFGRVKEKQWIVAKISNKKLVFPNHGRHGLSGSRLFAKLKGLM